MSFEEPILTPEIDTKTETLKDDGAQKESSLKIELESKYGNFNGWSEDIPKEDQDLLVSIFPEYRISFSEAGEMLLHYADLKRQFPNIKMEDVVALYSYTKDFAELNQQLRESSVSPENLKKITKLNEALSLLPDYTGTVYRGIQIDTKGVGLEVSMQRIDQKYKEGELVQFESFLSTAEAVEGSRGGLINYIIKSKHGKKISNIGIVGEYEVLFKTNSQFRVIKKEKDKSGRIFIYMEEVDSDGSSEQEDKA